MISLDKIILSGLSFYIACSIIYVRYKNWRIKNLPIGKLLMELIKTPKHILIFDTLFYPTVKISNYLLLKEILKEEKE